MITLRFAPFLSDWCRLTNKHLCAQNTLGPSLVSYQDLSHHFLSQFSSLHRVCAEVNTAFEPVFEGSFSATASVDCQKIMFHEKTSPIIARDTLRLDDDFGHIYNKRNVQEPPKNGRAPFGKRLACSSASLRVVAAPPLCVAISYLLGMRHARS